MLSQEGRRAAIDRQRIMKDTITGALVQRIMASKVFHPVCIGAENWLSGPREVGLRELELKLVQDGKVGNIPLSL